MDSTVVDGMDGMNGMDSADGMVRGSAKLVYLPLIETLKD